MFSPTTRTHRDQTLIFSWFTQCSNLNRHRPARFQRVSLCQARHNLTQSNHKVTGLSFECHCAAEEMEPPAKRHKKSQESFETEEDDDELTLAPDELNQRRDPAFQLEQGRALAANKLKFRLEEVIAKYSRDFTGIGDEIDLVTGEVVVDNGHVRSMRSEKDTGDGYDDVEEDSEEENERILRSVQGADRTPASERAISTSLQAPWHVEEPSWAARPAVGASPRLSSLFSNKLTFSTPSQSFSSFGSESSMNVSTDPVWQAPEIPESAFAHRLNMSGHRPTLGSSPSTRTTVKKALPPPVSPESDGEDALLGVSGNIVKKTAEKESPLIRRKFPAIDSSPNPQDIVHKNVVNDLLQLLPSTPPSSKSPKVSRPRGRPRGRPSKLKETQNAGSDTESQEDRRRRRREAEVDPQAHADFGIRGTKTQAMHSEAVSWDEVDLNNFQDVTGQKLEPAVQTLFVDIKTSKSQDTQSKVAKSSVKKAQKKLGVSLARSIARARTSLDQNLLRDQPLDEGLSDQERMTSGKDQHVGKTSRKDAENCHSFSDGEALVPKKRGRGRPKSLPTKISLDETQENGTHKPQLHPVDSTQDDKPRRGRGKPQIHSPGIAASETRKRSKRRPGEHHERSELDKIPQEHLTTRTSASTAPNAAKQAFSDGESRPDRAHESGSSREAQAARNAEEIKAAQTVFKRNDVDPSFAFSDDEVLLPRRQKRGAQKPEPARPHDISSNEAPSTVGSTDPGLPVEMEIVTAADSAHDSTGSRLRESSSSIQESILHLTITTGSSERQSDNGPQRVLPQAYAPASQLDHGDKIPEPTMQQASDVEAPQASTTPVLPVESVDIATERPSAPGKLRQSVNADSSVRVGAGKSRRNRSRRRQHSAEPKEPPARRASATEDAVQDAEGNTTNTASSTAASHDLPKTPRRNRPKASLERDPGTPSSTAAELVSLLSDDDDDEDEISFDLTDFTPSGRHRILVHRPSPVLARLLASPTSARLSFTASTSSHAAIPSTNKSHKATKSTRKKRASLLGPYPALPHTPRSSAGGRGTSSTSKVRTGSKLARSVVRARPRGDSAVRGTPAALGVSSPGVVADGNVPASPVGSVIQTPGGTRKRCGEDGFQCDRDFCFICL